MQDITIVVSLSLFCLVAYRIIVRHLEGDVFLLKGEVEAIQLKASLYKGKVALLEQYIEEYWHSVPEGESHNIQTLNHFREALDSLIDLCRQKIKEREIEIASVLISKLQGNPVEVGDEWSHFDLVKWEERGHRIVLKMCQKLTIEASVSSKKEDRKKYRRTPTLISIREISDLLREERSLRS